MTAADRDGFGQSWRDDLRFAWRFWGLRRRPLTLRVPLPAEARAIGEDPLRGRFGDDTVAVGTIDGRTVSIRDRDWFGWPDPPRYVIFVLGADGGVWCARDFDNWPRCWRIDGGSPDRS